MKKLLFVLLCVVALVGCKQGKALADNLTLSDVVGNVLDKMPTTNTGCYYNVNDAKFEFTNTARLAEYKGFSLNAGMATEKTVLATIEYDIVKLEKLGVKVDVLREIIISAGWGAGYKKVFDDNEFSNGAVATLTYKW